MPEADTELIAQAARAAGEIALRHFGSDPQTWDKPGSAGPVTEADLEIDAMLGKTLGSARPDYGWLSEETEDGTDRLRAERVFIADPLDGTRAFIEGSDDWGTSIAVAEHGEIIAAAVYLPRHATLFTATRGQGAQRDGTPIRHKPRDSVDGARFLGSKVNLNPRYWQGKSPPDLTQSWRSSIALRLCRVAEGNFDTMFALRPTWEWDIAAGALIAAEAGALATDRNGEPLRFNRPMPQTNGILAASPTLHGALLSRLLPAPPLPT